MSRPEPSPPVDGQRRPERTAVRRHRALIAYLLVYYALVAGAVVTVWRSGLIAHLDRSWTLLAIVVAVVLGATLAGLSRK